MATRATFKDESCDCASAQTSAPSQRYRTRRMNPFEETLLAESLSELSAEESVLVFEDIYGVDRIPEEDPNIVASRLEELEEEIGKIKGESRTAYDLAMHKDIKYVQNEGFRLKFLRADHFSIKKATDRMMKHFDLKLELFGEKKLVKDITFDDLSTEDQASASTGCYQSIFKDVKGRKILFSFPELHKADTWETFARVQWYHLMVGVEEEVAQRLGIVVVMVGFPKIDHLHMTMTSNRSVIPALPFRPAAIHACSLNHKWPTYLKRMLDVLGKNFKVRFHVHIEENALACLYTLQSFGIDPAIIPLEHDGRPNTALFLEHLEKRKMLERQRRDDASNNSVNEEDEVLEPQSVKEDYTDTQSSHVDGGVIPTTKDVLLGRGIKHRGNLAFDDMVDMEIVSYKNAPSQFHKSCIVLSAIKRVQSSGGRFLKRDIKTNEWFIADDHHTRESVSTRFRNKARKVATATTRLQYSSLSTGDQPNYLQEPQRQHLQSHTSDQASIPLERNFFLGRLEQPRMLERQSQTKHDTGKPSASIVVGPGVDGKGNLTMDKLDEKEIKKKAPKNV